MSDPRVVSVVTPTLNPGLRLLRCLESVAAQGYPNVEHIVVDGGSTDGTVELLERRRGIKWVSEPDSGQSNAINKGWAMSTGEVLGWLNADDELAEGAIAAVIEAFDADEQVGWVFGDVLTHEGRDTYVRKGAAPSDTKSWLARNLASQPGSFNARWALERVGYLDENFHYMMDLDLWVRLIDAGVKGAYVPQTLAVFEVHDDSKSGSVPRSRFVIEEAWARARSGREPSAAVALGRAAALRAFEEGGPDRGRALEELRRLLSDERFETLSPFRPRAEAGAWAETSVLEARSRNLRALRTLVMPVVWRYPETRARLRDAARRFVRRALRRISPRRR